MRPTEYRYHVADVFTDVRFAGNMLAVFPDAAGLQPDDMQTIARELNLSETTFVFAPSGTGLAQVRIFTPDRELPFAGHPTIGTAFVLCALGRIADDCDAFAFEEGIGDVPVRIERRADPFIGWLRTPPISFGRTVDAADAAVLLGVSQAELLPHAPAQIASAGNPFLYIALRDATSVDRAVLDRAALDRIVGDDATGVFFFAPHGDRCYSRMLAPGAGVAEDPATGSATGPLGAYLVRYKLLSGVDGTRFTNEQGVRMKRRSVISGVVHLDAMGEVRSVDVGGSAVMTTAHAVMYVDRAVTSRL